MIICFLSSRDLCEQLLCLMKPSDQKRSGTQKVLDAPVNLAEMAANNATVEDVSSIWVINRDDNLVSFHSYPNSNRRFICDFNLICICRKWIRRNWKKPSKNCNRNRRNGPKLQNCQQCQCNCKLPRRRK